MMNELHIKEVDELTIRLQVTHNGVKFELVKEDMILIVKHIQAIILKHKLEKCKPLQKIYSIDAISPLPNY